MTHRALAGRIAALPAPSHEDARAARYNRPPDPWLADTPAEYVHQLRALRLWAGQPGHKQITRRAEHKGEDPLASSTMYDALRPNRTYLPGLSPVRSIVIGCGGDLEQWVAVWRRLMLEELEQEHAAHPAAPQGAHLPPLRAVKERYPLDGIIRRVPASTGRIRNITRPVHGHRATTVNDVSRVIAEANDLENPARGRLARGLERRLVTERAVDAEPGRGRGR